MFFKSEKKEQDKSQRNSWWDNVVENRKLLSDSQRPDEEDFGYSIDNPIVAFSLEDEKSFIKKIRSLDGLTPRWKETVTYFMDGIHSIDDVAIHVYEMELNETTREVYFCPYGFDAKNPPYGMVLEDDVNCNPILKPETANAKVEEIFPSKQDNKIVEVIESDQSTEIKGPLDAEVLEDDENILIQSDSNDKCKKQLSQLAALCESGILTKEEYAVKCAQINHAEKKEKDDNLSALKALLDDKIITEEEYAAKIAQMHINKDAAIIGNTDDEVKVEKPKKNSRTLLYIIAAVVVVCVCAFVAFGEEIFGPDQAYLDALADYYSSAAFVRDGDDDYYHHMYCDSFPDEWSYRMYNSEWAKDEGYKPCPTCWGQDVEDYVNANYGSQNEDYEDAAIEYVSACVVRVSEDTKYYHRYGCEKIEDYDFWMNNIQYAVSLGYSPCSTCWGGENIDARTYILNTYGDI